MDSDLVNGFARFSWTQAAFHASLILAFALACLMVAYVFGLLANANSVAFLVGSLWGQCLLPQLALSYLAQTGAWGWSTRLGQFPDPERTSRRDSPIDSAQVARLASAYYSVLAALTVNVCVSLRVYSPDTGGVSQHSLLEFLLIGFGLLTAHLAARRLASSLGATRGQTILLTIATFAVIPGVFVTRVWVRRWLRGTGYQLGLLFVSKTKH